MTTKNIMMYIDFNENVLNFILMNNPFSHKETNRTSWHLVSLWRVNETSALPMGFKNKIG